MKHFGRYFWKNKTKTNAFDQIYNKKMLFIFLNFVLGKRITKYAFLTDRHVSQEHYFIVFKKSENI